MALQHLPETEADVNQKSSLTILVDFLAVFKSGSLVQRNQREIVGCLVSSMSVYNEVNLEWRAEYIPKVNIPIKDNI